MKVGYIDDGFATRKVKIVDFPEDSVLIQSVTISPVYKGRVFYSFGELRIVPKSDVKDISEFDEETEPKHIFGEELAEERRKEIVGRSD